jgi:hypothetical protein
MIYYIQTTIKHCRSPASCRSLPLGYYLASCSFVFQLFYELLRSCSVEWGVLGEWCTEKYLVRLQETCCFCQEGVVFCNREHVLPASVTGAYSVSRALVTLNKIQNAFKFCIQCVRYSYLILSTIIFYFITKLFAFRQHLKPQSTNHYSAYFYQVTNVHFYVRGDNSELIFLVFVR